MKSLEQIMRGVSMLQVWGDSELKISSVTPDSRQVIPECVFVAISGTKVDGNTFVDDAIKRGARVIVSEHNPNIDLGNITWIKVSDCSQAIGFMAANYYDRPSSSVKVIGVTGTNGKTTIATMLYQVITSLGYQCGLISTVKICGPGFSETARLTTPDVMTLQLVLRRMVDAGCSFVFMEVSSHAMAQHRVSGIEFSGGIFTNLTHDHLDYHGTFQAYLNAKKSFFDHLPGASFALINADEKHADVMVQNCEAKVYRYGLRHAADFKGKILENRLDGLVLQVNAKAMSSRLIGAFNAYNLLAAYGAACLLGIEESEALLALSGVTPVEGRMELVADRYGRIGIVDFAHTPDALEQVLKTVQAMKPKGSRTIVVVGCGGDRDAAKRPVMGQIAATHADMVILTSDNPRSESADRIILEMEAGIDHEGQLKVQKITDRGQAIQVATLLAKPADVVLVAGKGHEKYQEINGIKHDFDDVKVLREAFVKNIIPGIGKEESFQFGSVR